MKKLEENQVELRIGVIYKYTSPNGKVYIGQTINEKSRKSQHKLDTPKGTTYFGKAINKYGFDNFKYEVLIKFKPADKLKVKRVLDKLEKRYIKIYNSNNRDFGYNLNDGGDGNLGYKHTEEALVKIAYHNQNMLQETKDKIAETLTKHVRTAEHCKNISKSSTNKRRVIQMDLEGNIIMEHESLSVASEVITTSSANLKTKVNKISECCLGKRPTCYKFKWKYWEE